MHEGVGRLEGGDEELFEAGLDVLGEEGWKHVRRSESLGEVRAWQDPARA
jgi:hypothetical protein